jgi:lipopolysaccharide transport system ATP-binding protein
VKDVSFELRRGECLGLIGRNGAGKTTLLKILNGLIKPDTGKVSMSGRVGALIALGAGFNPILTGKENIMINASVLGLSGNEINNKIDEIIDFSGISAFIDSPVQGYSSGMNVRLGFAIATALDPDILILDEVLAVGDAAFRAKCFKRIGTISRKCAILFVSHDQSQATRICSSAMLMKNGASICYGQIKEVLDRYNRDESSEINFIPTLETHDAIRSFSMEGSSKGRVLKAGDAVSLRFIIDSNQDLSIGYAHVNFFDPSGIPAGQADFSSNLQTIKHGLYEYELNLEALDLAESEYTINVAIFAGNRIETLIHAVNCARVRIIGKQFMWCAYKIPVVDVEAKSLR